MKKTLRFSLFVLLFVTMTFASTAGPSFPTSAVDGGGTVGGGVNAWTNPTNVEASDSAFATVNISSGSAGDDLNCTTFGFSVPAGATINGITVEVNDKTSSAGFTTGHAQLLKTGAATGTAKTWALVTTATTNTLGGSADLWSATLASSDVNATNFGVVVWYTATAIRTVSTDFVRITVTYTPAGSTAKMFQVF